MAVERKSSFSFFSTNFFHPRTRTVPSLQLLLDRHAREREEEERRVWVWEDGGGVARDPSLPPISAMSTHIYVHT